MKIRDYLNSKVKLAEDTLIYYMNIAAQPLRKAQNYYIPPNVIEDTINGLINSQRYRESGGAYDSLISGALNMLSNNPRFSGNVEVPGDYFGPRILHAMTRHSDRDFNRFYQNQDDRPPDYTASVNLYLSEIEPILDTMSEITSYKSKAQNQASSNASIQRQITETQQKTAESSRSLQIVKSALDSFSLEDMMKSKSPQQKSLILLKTWGSTNGDDINIMKAIIDTGFDPHYRFVSDQDLAETRPGFPPPIKSFVTTALTNNDEKLFDLLIANKINFNNLFPSFMVVDRQYEPIFQHIIRHARLYGNMSFVKKMLATGQDFSDSVVNMALNNDGEDLQIVFEHNKELAKIKKYGCSLLQLSLEKAHLGDKSCFKSAEQILKYYPDSASEVNDKGLSPLAVMILKNNGQAIDLLRSNGADVTLEVKKALAGDYVVYFNKILACCPDAVTKDYGGLPLTHLVVQDGNVELLFHLLYNRIELCDLKDSSGRSVLYFTLSKGKDDIAYQLVLKKLLGDWKIDFESVFNKAMLEDDSTVIAGNTNFFYELAHLDKVKLSGRTILHTALKHDKINIAKAIISLQYKDKANIEEQAIPLFDSILTVKSALAHSQIAIVKKLLLLDEPLLEKLSKVENNHLTQTLLRDPEFIKIVDSTNNTLLHLACKSGNGELVERIVTTDHDLINKQNSSGQTPLHILLESPIAAPIKSQIAEVILKLHPDISLKDSSDQTTPDLAICSAEILTMFYDLNLLGINEEEGAFF